MASTWEAREYQNEPAAATVLSFGGEPRPHRFGDPPSDRQAESDPADSRRPCRSRAEERIEDVRQVIRRESWSKVRDGQLGLGIPHPHPNHDRAGGRAVLGRIVEQVVEQLGQQFRMSTDRRNGLIRVEIEPHVRMGGPPLDDVVGGPVTQVG